MSDAVATESHEGSLVDTLPQYISPTQKAKLRRVALMIEKLNADPDSRRDLFNYYGFTVQSGYNSKGVSDAVGRAAELLGVSTDDIRRAKERIYEDDEFGEKWEKLQERLEPQLSGKSK